MHKLVKSFTTSRLFTFSCRAYSSQGSELKERLRQIIPQKKEEMKFISSTLDNESLGTVTVGQVYGGARGIQCLITETSLLDSEEGIRFRGFSIPEIQNKLPKAPGGTEPLPEGMLWLLMTGEIPSQSQVNSVTQELKERSFLPEWVKVAISQFPKTLHPMTQLSATVNLLQYDSKFYKKYTEGSLRKNEYWEYTYEDSMNLIAKLPELTSLIYRHTFKNGHVIPPKLNLDWAANHAHMLGYDSPEFHDLLRLHFTIHSDHEGGNVSAHATHLVGSTLSDPYLSYAAGMNGLAGPLHGLANQECLEFIEKILQAHGNVPPTKETVSEQVWKTLNEGLVIPGYGHAVLRKTDPRFTCLRQYAVRHNLDRDPYVNMVRLLSEVTPDILTKHGKTKNPWPNVDSHSGALLKHFGLEESHFYTVLFGVSRALGVLSSLTWDRAFGFPIERPKSISTEWVKKTFQNKLPKSN